MSEGESHLPSELLLVGALFFAPFAFGTTENWAKATFSALIYGAMFLRYRALGLSGIRPSRVPPAFYGYALLLGLAILQALFPRPPTELDQARGIFTFSRALTLSWVLDWSLYAAVLFVLPRIFQNSKAAEFYAWAMLVCGALVAAVGIAQLQAGNTHYFGLRPVSDFRVPFGPFPNKNHAGTFLSMSVLIGIGLIVRQFEAFRQSREGERRDELVGKLVILATLEFLVLAGLFRARSRGAVVATACSGTLALTAYFFASRVRRQFGNAILFLLLPALALAAVSFAPVKWATYIPGAAERSLTLRIAMVEDGWNMTKSHPFFGSGLGALRSVYPALKSPKMKGYFSDHLHCDPLQLAVEAGLPSAIFFFITMGVTLWPCIRPPPKGKVAPAPFTYFFGSAFVAFLIHQLVEFPSQITSVHALALASLSACWGLSHGGDIQNQDPAPPSRKGLIFPGALLIAYLGLIVTPRLAAAYCDLLAYQYPHPSRHYFQINALRWEPNTDRYLVVSRSSLQLAADNPAAAAPLLRMALGHVSEVLRLEPYHPDALHLKHRIAIAHRNAIRGGTPSLPPR